MDLGNQITPIPVVLDGEQHTVEVPLEVIAQDLSSGRGLTLQLVATTTAYAEPPLGGTLEASSIRLDLPVADEGELAEG